MTTYPAGLALPSVSLGAAIGSLGNFQTSLNGSTNGVDNQGNPLGISDAQLADVNAVGALITQLEALVAKYQAQNA